MSQVEAESRLQRQRRRQVRHKKYHPDLHRPARPRAPKEAIRNTEVTLTPRPATDLTQSVVMLAGHDVLQRTISALIRNGVSTLAELVDKTASDLRGYHIGQGSIDRIAAALKAIDDLHLKIRRPTVT
jgi:hypothetical protein